MNRQIEAPRIARPREGDRKLIGDIEYVRRRKVLLNRLGQPIGFDRWGGFDQFTWEPA